MYVQVRPPLLPVYLPMPSSVEAFQIIWVKCPRPLWYLCTLKLYQHTSSYLRTNQTNKIMKQSLLILLTVHFLLIFETPPATPHKLCTELKPRTDYMCHCGRASIWNSPPQEIATTKSLHNLNHLQLTIIPSMYEITGWKGSPGIKLNLCLHCYTFWWQLTEKKAVIRG